MSHLKKETILPAESIATIIVIIGITQGLFIGSALLMDKTYSTQANRALGLTIILFSLQGVLDVLSFWRNEDTNVLLRAVLSFGLQGIIYLPYFFSVLKSLKIKFFLPAWVLFIPFVISLIHSSILAFAILKGREELIDKFYLDELWTFHWYLNLVLVVSLHAYLFRVIKRANDSVNKDGAFMLWRVLAIILAIWVFFNIHGILFSSDLTKFIVFWGFITLFMFWITFTGVIKQRLINEQNSLHLILNQKNFELDLPIQEKSEPIEQKNEELKQENHSGAEEKGEEKEEVQNKYYEEFLRLLNEERLYRKQELNRQMVAKKLKISPGYFSTVLNQYSLKTFTEIINEYRVEEVKKIIADGSLNHFSLTAIGLEVGFKSKSSFFTNFKKITGLSPSDYKKKMLS